MRRRLSLPEFYSNRAIVANVFNYVKTFYPAHRVYYSGKHSVMRIWRWRDKEHNVAYYSRTHSFREGNKRKKFMFLPCSRAIKKRTVMYPIRHHLLRLLPNPPDQRPWPRERRNNVVTQWHKDIMALIIEYCRCGGGIAHYGCSARFPSSVRLRAFVHATINNHPTLSYSWQRRDVSLVSWLPRGGRSSWCFHIATKGEEHGDAATIWPGHGIGTIKASAVC